MPRFAIVLSVFVVVASVGAAAAGTGHEPAKSYFVDVRLDDLAQAAKLAEEGFDIAGIDRAAKAAGVIGTADDLARLTELGWEYTIRKETTPGESDFALSDYTDPQEWSAFLDQVQAAYPSLAKKFVLRDTLFEGQKLLAVKITRDVAEDHDRPVFILDAQHHAREVMTTEIARDMVDYLTSRYATDAAVRRWVDHIEIWVVGSVNPDGAMYAFTTDSNWRKNRHPSCAVDLNRNYRFLWGSCNGSSGSCSSDTFRGAVPESEPETQGMVQLVGDKRPFFTLSYHSYGEYLMYSYGCTNPDEMAAMDGIAQSLNAILENDSGVTGQYATGPIWSTIYSADGGSVDTQYGTFGAYAYVIEVNASSFQPDYATWRNVTIQRQRTAWQYFLDKTLDAPQIRGHVTDALTGLPLAARVGVQEVNFTHGESDRTANAKGAYRWLAEPNRTYHVTYSLPGYCPEIRTVSVGTGPADQDVALGHPAAPSTATAVGNGDNRIDVSWSPVADASEYRVYRSLSAGGPYDLAGTVAAPQTAFSDSPVSGGVAWHYVVRAFEQCESPDSPEAVAIASGPCTLGPSFAGLGSVADTEAATCSLNLTWPTAVARCHGPLTYAVHRSTTASFTPSSSNLVASGLAGTSFSDHSALASGVKYYYVVRAWDAESGADDGNLIVRSASPTGPRTSGTWSDDAGDTGSAKLSGASPWSVLATGGKTAPKVYATGTYTDNLCSALATPAIRVQATSSLSFASKYDIETDYDAGIVEVARGPAYDTWTKLPIVAYPDRLLYGGNACGFPTSGANTVFSRNYATPAYSPSPYTGSLAAYAGQDIAIRWRLSTDGGLTRAGWWVDDVRVTNALLPGTCSAGAAPNPKEPSPDGSSMTLGRAGAGTAVSLAYTPACGTLDNVAYWGVGPFAGAVSWTASACTLGNTGRATFDPGNPPPGEFFYFVLVGQNATAEGSYGRSSSGTERPEAVGVGACDKARTLGGTCP